MPKHLASNAINTNPTSFLYPAEVFLNLEIQNSRSPNIANRRAYHASNHFLCDK